MTSDASYLINYILLLFWVPVTCTVIATSRHPVGSTNDDVSKTVEYRLYEEMIVPHHLGNVKKDSGLYDPLVNQKHRNHSTKSSIKFHFRSPQQPTNHHLDLFRLDEATGDLFVVQRIDRDFLCPSSISQGSLLPQYHKADCPLTFDVVVKPIQYFRIIKVTVIIIDINDNSPRFQKKKSKLEIVESSPVGSLFLLPAAEDDDAGIFAVQVSHLSLRLNIPN